MNPKVREVQVGQFSTGGVGHFYPGANTADYVFPITMKQPPFVWCANGNNDGLCD